MKLSPTDRLALRHALKRCKDSKRHNEYEADKAAKLYGRKAEIEECRASAEADNAAIDVIERILKDGDGEVRP